MTVLPDHVLRRMDPKDRASLGKAGRTAAECQAKLDLKRERELQNEMRNLLEQRELFYLWQRMDKPTRMRRGIPDFIIFLRGRTPLLVEAKTAKGNVSDEQTATFMEINRKTGMPVNVIRSFEDFVRLLDAASGLGKPKVNETLQHRPME